MANTYSVNETIKSTSGFYFGDPCYAMSREDYDELIHQRYKDDKNGRDGKFTVNGHELIVAGTAYGDGFFAGWNSSYSVDSGLLGVVPLELIKNDPTDMGWGWVCKKTGDVNMSTSEDGSFAVCVNGRQVEGVETGDEDECEDDEWGEDED